MGCGQRNIHSYRPTTLAGVITLAACYIPLGVVLTLVLGCILPYLYWYAYGFAVVVANRPEDWFLAYWCWAGAVPLFGGLLVSYLRCVFTSPGYSTSPQWCHPPRVLHGDGHVRPSNPQSLNCSVVAAPGNPQAFQMTTVTAAAPTSPPAATASSTPASPQPSNGISTNGVDATNSSMAAAAPVAPQQPIYHGYFTPRFCERCRLYRPQGSHHCSDCNRCVLGMDHHCPWVCNCVGARNHKYFVLFLFYIFLSGVHISATIAAGYSWYDAANRASLVQHTVNVMIGIASFVFAIAMGLFFAFHIHLIASDTTTVDRNIAALKGLASRRNNGGATAFSSNASANATLAVVLASGDSSSSKGASSSATGSGVVVADGYVTTSGGADGTTNMASDLVVIGGDDNRDDGNRHDDDNNDNDDHAMIVPIDSDDESEAVHKAARTSGGACGCGNSCGGGVPRGCAAAFGQRLRRIVAAFFTPIRAFGLCLTSCCCRGMAPHQLKSALAAVLGAPDAKIGILIWFIPVTPTWPHPHPARRAAGEWTLDPPEKVSPYVATTVGYEGYVLVPPAQSLLMRGPTFLPSGAQQLVAATTNDVPVVVGDDYNLQQQEQSEP